MTKVRFSSLDGVFELIEELGADPADVMAGVRLPGKYLDPEHNTQYIDFEQAERLLQAAADVTECDYFGALLGTRQELTILGLLGHVMQLSPNIEAALRELITYLSMQIPSGASIRLDSAGKYASVIYRVSGDHPFVKQSNELALSEISHFLGILCGFGWRPIEVHFAHKNRSERAPYRKLFGAPVKYAVTFSSGLEVATGTEGFFACTSQCLIAMRIALSFTRKY